MCHLGFLNYIKLKFFICSEWVLGNREDLIKNITAELQPENGEVNPWHLFSTLEYFAHSFFMNLMKLSNLIFEMLLV